MIGYHPKVLTAGMVPEISLVKERFITQLKNVYSCLAFPKEIKERQDNNLVEEREKEFATVECNSFEKLSKPQNNITKLSSVIR